MRKSVITVLALIVIIVLAPSGFSQQTNAYKPDGWQGLTLDQSTPEDAVRTLGQPVSDKTDRLHIHLIDKWITPKHQQKIFRVLTFKNVGHAKQAKLAFLDNKLVRILIDYKEKKFPAKDLKEVFGFDFVLIEGGIPSGSTPSMYEGQKEGRERDTYPAAYFTISVTPRSLIFAFVGRGGIKGAFDQANNLKTKEPGSLLHLDLLSRTLAVDEPNRGMQRTRTQHASYL
jgi:hypothetical protein